MKTLVRFEALNGLIAHYFQQFAPTEELAMFPFRVEALKNTFAGFGFSPSSTDYMSDWLVFTAEDCSKITSGAWSKADYVRTLNTSLNHPAVSHDVMFFSKLLVENIITGCIEDNINNTHVDEIIASKAIKDKLIQEVYEVMVTPW